MAVGDNINQWKHTRLNAKVVLSDGFDGGDAQSKTLGSIAAVCMASYSGGETIAVMMESPSMRFVGSKVKTPSGGFEFKPLVVKFSESAEGVISKDEYNRLLTKFTQHQQGGKRIASLQITLHDSPDMDADSQLYDRTWKRLFVSEVKESGWESSNNDLRTFEVTMEHSTLPEDPDRATWNPSLARLKRPEIL